MEALLFLTTVTTHSAQAADNEHDVQTADDALVTLRVFEVESVLHCVVVGEDTEARAAAHFEAEAALWAGIGAAFRRLGTANGASTTNVALHIFWFAHHRVVGEDIFSMLTRVVAGEAEGTATDKRISGARLVHLSLPFVPFPNLDLVSSTEHFLRL